MIDRSHCDHIWYTLLWPGMAISFHVCLILIANNYTIMQRFPFPCDKTGAHATCIVTVLWWCLRGGPWLSVTAWNFREAGYDESVYLVRLRVWKSCLLHVWYHESMDNAQKTRVSLIVPCRSSWDGHMWTPLKTMIFVDVMKKDEQCPVVETLLYGKQSDLVPLTTWHSL